MEKERKFSVRGFISLLLTFSFMVLAISGIFLYVAPQCSVARAISWSLAGLTKDQCTSVHMASAFVFLGLACVHLLVYNWKAFVAYIKPKKDRIMFLRPELFISLIAAAVLLVGAVLYLPPFHLVPETHDAIQRHYREKVDFDTGADDARERRPGRGLGGRGR